MLSALLVLVGTAATAKALARIIAPGRPGVIGPGGQVNLPYMQQDASGNMWRIYQGGWLQQQGNMPLYSQGAMLMINGNQAQVNNNQARLDEKTGELVMENMQSAGFSATRRVFVDNRQRPRHPGARRLSRASKDALDADHRRLQRHHHPDVLRRS